MNNEEYNVKRQAKNKEILQKLETLIANNPEQRFGQIIANYVFPNYREKDFFYEEPWETCSRLEEVLCDGENKSDSLSKTTLLSFIGKKEKEFMSLYLYGDTFSGKTQFVTNLLKTWRLYEPDKKIEYITAFDFRRLYTESVMKNMSNDFIERYYQTDVLVIEDIEELQTTPRTQEMLLHIWNNAQQKGGTIIVTCNCSIDRLEGYNERLLSRFRNGVMLNLPLHSQTQTT